MEGLTFLQLPGEATIRLVSVSQPSTVYETATEVKNDTSLDDCSTLITTDKLSTESSSGIIVSNKEECRCLLCLQTIENTGAYKEVLSKNAKLSFADFCKFLKVNAPPTPKNVLRKLHTPLCKKCLGEMIKIRELVTQIETIERCLTSTRTLLKEQVLENYGTQNCDSIDDMQGNSNALTDLASITYSIRSSIRNGKHH